MVNFVTRITVKLTTEQQAFFETTSYTKQLPFKNEQLNSSTDRRNISLLQILEKSGFAFKTGKDCIYAVSTETEAQDAKEILLAQGFHDHEFQIYLEYTRGWGTL